MVLRSAVQKGIKVQDCPTGEIAINWFRKKFGKKTAIEKNRSNPVLHDAVQNSAEIYDVIPLRKFISDSEREDLARELFLEISRICSARDPIAACRESLAATMLRFAQYQVLVIPPEPEEDESGLRAQPGISGELRRHLVEIAADSETLRTDLFGTTGFTTYDSVWKAIQTEFWKIYWRLHTINAARLALGDKISDRDWFLPFMHAACASAEHVYRHNLDMEPVFDADVAKPVSTAYSIYTDIVVSGAADPDEEWRDYYKDSNIPLPHFESN